MDEIYIAKENKDILTRVSLYVGGEKYIEESPYSDMNTLELLMCCIEGYCAMRGWSKKDLVNTMKKALPNGNDYSKDTHSYTDYLTPSESVTMIIEQYDYRNTTTKLCNKNKLLTTIIECFIACNVQTSWLGETVYKWMEEYIEDYEQFFKDAEREEEDNSEED